MASAVSVVVIGKDFRVSLDKLVEHLDQQSLSTSEFELVAVDQGSSDGSAERLEQLKRRRPNLTVVDRRAEGLQADDAAWLHSCSAEYVLRLDPSLQLFPEALERAHSYANEHGLDVVALRVVQPGVAVDAVLTADSADLGPAERASALSAPVLLVRRTLCQDTEEPLASYLPEYARVGVLASYPAALAGAEFSSSVDSGSVVTAVLRQTQRSASWLAHHLQVELSGVVELPAGADDLGEGPRMIGLLRHSKSGMAHLLDLTGTVTPPGSGSGGWTWHASVSLDVRTAALGAPLPSGLWEMDLQLVSTSASFPPVTVGWMSCPPAVVHGDIVVPAPAEGPAWQLDIGATTWPLVHHPDPADGTVCESAAGSLLVLRLPRVHVSGAEVVAGEIALEQLRLPAAIITDGHSARLEGYVSGLASSPRIATKFGAGPMRQSGLCLLIANEGAMELTRAKPATAPAATSAAKPAAAAKPKAAKPKAGAGKRKPAQRKPLSRMQHLRRALPEPLEPVAQRMASNPIARTLYRKVARL